MNCTTRGREKAIYRKLGSTKMWFGEEKDCKCCGGVRASIEETRERERGTEGEREAHRGSTFPKPMTGKMKGDIFHKFLQPLWLKDWRFKGHQSWLA